MKKLFLFSLMALCTCVMAWGATVEVGTFEQLKAAIDGASDGDVIKLIDDIDYGTAGGTNYLNIKKSITLDGQGHTLTGACKRANADFWATLYVNEKAEDVAMMDIVIKDITLVNNKITSDYGASIRFQHNINTVTLTNVVMDITGGLRGNSAPMFLGGSDTNNPTYTLNNCKLLGKNNDYPYYSWIKAHIIAKDTYFNGYCGMYFKDGSDGTVVDADACDFDAPNVHDYSGGWNNFGVFATEATNITLNLHNCGMNAQETGFKANQGMILAKKGGCVVNISGDNSHINGRMVLEDSKNPGYWLAFLLLTGDMTITGGTYSVDPSHYGPCNLYTSFGNQVPTLPDEEIYANFVPDGYEVKEITMEGVATPLYRVVKKAQEKEEGVMYDLNDKVAGEGVAEGNNPVSSFDLSTGTDMTLNQETTTAGYVQVSDKDNGVDPATPTTVTVGTDTQDQTLVINNGLDVQGNSQVIVEAGSTLQIGEGGINTEKPENIVIEADENGAASLIMDPAITVNQTPNLTVEMKVSKAGKDTYGDYWWHRFAMPVGELENAWTKSPNYGTYLYGWNYATNDWEKVEGGSTSMKPWKGYTLTYNEAYNEDEVVTYTFKGNLVGNTDAALTFEEEGYQFFGNSYTGYIDVLTLIQQLTDGNVDQTVWMWNPANQTYTAVPLDKLSDPVKAARLKEWQKEVAPMQTFIMRLRGATSANESVNYADAIWGNPRYGNNPAQAPRRKVASADEAYMEIVITAANGQSDRVDFTVNSERNDAFENGFDASKYMNERYINVYATVAGEDYTSVATDNIEGKTISLQTKNDINYTISFENVETEAYALRDNVTGAIINIEEGAVYEFAAQPNSVIEGRFEIVSRANAPTAIENTDVKANVKGIYTIMGQYLGEDFDVLPAGVYVINGVKIVK